MSLADCSIGDIPQQTQNIKVRWAGALDQRWGPTEAGPRPNAQGMTVHYLCHSTYEVQPGNGVIIHPGAWKTLAARGPDEAGYGLPGVP